MARPRWCDTRRRKSEPTGNTNFGLNRRVSPRPYLAAKDIPVLIANSRGPETFDELAPGIWPRVTPMSAFRPSPHVSRLNRKDCSGSN